MQDPWVKTQDPWVKTQDPWVKMQDPWVKTQDPWVKAETHNECMVISLPCHRLRLPSLPLPCCISALTQVVGHTWLQNKPISFYCDGAVEPVRLARQRFDQLTLWPASHVYYEKVAMCTRHVYPPRAPVACTRHVHPPRAPATCTRHVHPPRAPATCTRHVHPPRVPAMCTRHMHPPCVPAMCTRHVYPPCIPAISYIQYERLGYGQTNQSLLPPALLEVQ